jgi:hypothetical protein
MSFGEFLDMLRNIDMLRNKWKIIKNKLMKWNKLKPKLLDNLLKINYKVLTLQLTLPLKMITNKKILKMLKELLNLKPLLINLLNEIKCSDKLTKNSL